MGYLSKLDIRLHIFQFNYCRQQKHNFVTQYHKHVTPLLIQMWQASHFRFPNFQRRSASFGMVSKFTAFWIIIGNYRFISKLCLESKISSVPTLTFLSCHATRFNCGAPLYTLAPHSSETVVYSNIVRMRPSFQCQDIRSPVAGNNKTLVRVPAVLQNCY